MSASPLVWGRLLAIGSKEPTAYRQVELSTTEFFIGRKDSCHEKISDQTVSSVHIKITLVSTGDEDVPFEVRLEDNSANGTYVNSQKVGRGNCVRLLGNDEIGLVKPCGGAEPPPWAFLFQDFTDQLSHAQIAALLSGSAVALPSLPAAAPAPPIAAAIAAQQSVSKGGSLLQGLRRLSGGSSSGANAAKAAEQAVAAAPKALAPSASSAPSAPAPSLSAASLPAAFEDDPQRSLYASMQILAAPDPKGLRELRGTLRRGDLNVTDFNDADGPNALLDVVGEVIAKPKLSWIDREVLDGVLAAIQELMNAPDGAPSLLRCTRSVERLVALLAVSEMRVLTKVLSILTLLVVCAEEGRVENAIRQSNRFSFSSGSFGSVGTSGSGKGGSVGPQLVALLGGGGDGAPAESGVACEALTLVNTLVACSPDAEALLAELSAARLDDAIANLEPLLATSPELVRQAEALAAARAPPKAAAAAAAARCWQCYRRGATVHGGGRRQRRNAALGHRCASSSAAARAATARAAAAARRCGGASSSSDGAARGARARGDQNPAAPTAAGCTQAAAHGSAAASTARDAPWCRRPRRRCGRAAASDAPLAKGTRVQAGRLGVGGSAAVHRPHRS